MMFKLNFRILLIQEKEGLIEDLFLIQVARVEGGGEGLIQERISIILTLTIMLLIRKEIGMPVRKGMNIGRRMRLQSQV